MSATAAAYRFYDATLGKKAVMAVTGLIWFGFVIGHMVGNLQIFLPKEHILAYARFLHTNLELLWPARIVLIVAIVLHVWSAISLTAQKNRARPQGYVRKKDVPSNLTARTMFWGGLALGGFIIFHLAHLTWGMVGPLPYPEINGGPDVYRNVIYGFRTPWISAIYILSMIALGMHLYHGAWSMFQTLGVNHPRYTPKIKALAAAIAIIIAIGNISMPIAVMLRLVGGELQ